MLSFYFQGFALGAAMILPLGPQNAFVLNQGIRRQYHLMIASLCALSDVVLICAGIFGGSAILMQSPWLLALVTWGGVAFLLWYGFGALKTALAGNPELASADVLKQGRLRIITTMLAVTWLTRTFILIPLWCSAALAGSLTPYRNAPLRSAPSARLSSGSSALRCLPPGLRRGFVPHARNG